MHQLWRQKTPLHLTAYYIDKKEIMVLKGEISPSKRAYILHLTHEKKLSIWIKQNNAMFHKPQSTGKKNHTRIEHYEKQENRDLGVSPWKLSSQEEWKTFKNFEKFKIRRR